SESYASTHVTLCSPRMTRAIPQSSARKKRALSPTPSRLSCELPATPGWPDQYAMDGEIHHGARNGCASDDFKLIARSRNCTDSSRCSTRRPYSVSFGQSRSSQSPRIGKIDKAKAIQTAVRDLIGSSKRGSAIAKIDMKK